MKPARKAYVVSASHHIRGRLEEEELAARLTGSRCGARRQSARCSGLPLSQRVRCSGSLLGVRGRHLSRHTPQCPRQVNLGVSSARGGPVGEPLVDDVAGPADGVRAQPEGLGECAIGTPSTQRASADADAVKHVGNAQHGFGGHSR